ncbi:MAG: DNA polymerase III subunit delta [Lachnospiraceae bacterium]
MQSILMDIKEQNFKPVYLLYGEEDYLRRQYRDKLKAALVDAPDSLNFHSYEGSGVAVPEIIDLAETLPFFSDRRVIVIENSGLFKHGGEEMADYLQAQSETTFFIFIEQEIDKRSRLFKAVKDKGRAVEFTTQEEATLIKWINTLVAKENKTISREALHTMLEKTGSDMENIRTELEKLFCYTLDKDTIDTADVEAICTVRISNRIFDMVNSIAEKRQKQALSLYYDLLELREPPMRILFLITRQFNLLMQVKELKAKGYDNRTIGEKTGLHSFVVGKYVAQANKLTAKALQEALEDCIESDASVKMGKLIDKMSIELLIIKYSAAS